jgi:hypothetical protein
MNNKLIAKIEGFFNDPSSLSMEEMEQFVHETLKFFDKLRNVMVNGTEEEKKEALKEAQEMQEKLQGFAQKAYEKTGMKPEDIAKFLSQGNVPKTDMNHFQNAQREIEDYQKSIQSRKKV